ncbi:blue copper protein-like [Oryza brachyantha]|uniref:Phytocyanin domain-containing protein n=1 Tax=Oryza brachyantha TaxID=4533 RepID=J3L4S4_ORYBR|nr:blue copper protein-like [Oryza brachyantha]
MAEMKAAICIAAAVSLFHVVLAADYTIGNAAGGWGGEYKAWVASQKFAPGDTLTFKYSSYHNVVEVTKDDYEACSATNPVSADSSGSTTIVLTAPGKRYFICGAPGHCQSGMKLEVDVADRPAPETPSPPPSLPPSPRHAKRRPAPAPMPLPPAPAPAWSPAPAPAATQPRHPGHKKHRSRHLPPKPAPAMAPTVQSAEADFPLADFAPMSSSPPPPPMSSDAEAMRHQKWSDVIVGLVALRLVVLAV